MACRTGSLKQSQVMKVVSAGMGVEEPHKALLVCVCVCVVKRSRIYSVERKMVGRDTREMGDSVVGESGEAHPPESLLCLSLYLEEVSHFRESLPGQGTGSYFITLLPLC